MGDNRLGGRDLWIFCFEEIAQQKPRTVPTNRGREGRDAYGFGDRWWCCQPD